MAYYISQTDESHIDYDDTDGEKRTIAYRLVSDAVLTFPAAWLLAYDHVEDNNKIGSLIAQSIGFRELKGSAGNVFDFNVTYTKDGTIGNLPSGTLQNIKGTLNFSTKGGSVKMTQSKETLQRIGNVDLGVPAPNFRGLINYNGGIAQGVDVKSPILHLSLATKIPSVFLTQQFLATFYTITGCTNSAAKWGFPAKSLLFCGVDGSTDGQGTASISFEFDYSPPYSGEIQPFNGTTINKGGWDYMWTYFEQRSVSGKTQAVPVGLYVERVYDSVSFDCFNFIQIA